MQGIFTALATPFKDYEIDWPSLEKLVGQQKDVSGFVVSGTTAEAPTLSLNEVQKIFEFVKKHARPEQKIIVGTGTNCTRNTIERTQAAKQWGADAALVVVPYYNKPTQRGLFHHFVEVAKRSEFDTILYDVPSRTVVSIDPDNILQMAKEKHIIGIKDATADLERHDRLLKGRPQGFSLLSGDDGTCEEYIKRGGDGVISVVSHLVPDIMMGWLEQKYGQEARTYELACKAVTLSANPIPLKASLQQLGLFETAEMRLPLVELEEELKVTLGSILKDAGLLK